jgi:hypothetical protein
MSTSVSLRGRRVTAAATAVALVTVIALAALGAGPSTITARMQHADKLGHEPRHDGERRRDRRDGVDGEQRQGDGVDRERRRVDGEGERRRDSAREARASAFLDHGDREHDKLEVAQQRLDRKLERKESRDSAADSRELAADGREREHHRAHGHRADGLQAPTPPLPVPVFSPPPMPVPSPPSSPPPHLPPKPIAHSNHPQHDAHAHASHAHSHHATAHSHTSSAHAAAAALSAGAPGAASLASLSPTALRLADGGGGSLPPCPSAAVSSSGQLGDCAVSQLHAIASHASHAGYWASHFAPPEPLKRGGGGGDPPPPVPLNRRRFACTPDGAQPLSADGATFVPCCPGSRAVVDDAVGGSGSVRVCREDQYTPNGILECVSTVVVPEPFRCDLTSTEGASSCPYGRMTPGARYLLYPGGATSCLYAATLTGRGACEPSLLPASRASSRYSFDVQVGSASKLLLFFQGGGACWTASGPGASACTSSATVYADGLLDPRDASNRYADFTVVQIHYCSGDVHVGNVTQPWRSAGWPRLPVQQRGAANTRAVLAWVLAQPEFKSLDELVIGGLSAGSLGAQIWAAPILAALAPRARASAAIFDSFAGVLPTQRKGDVMVSAGGRVLRDVWKVCGSTALVPAGAARAACEAGELDVAVLLEPTLRAWPAVTFTQLQSKQDLVQRVFFDLLAMSYNLTLRARRQPLSRCTLPCAVLRPADCCSDLLPLLRAQRALSRSRARSHARRSSLRNQSSGTPSLPPAASATVTLPGNTALYASVRALFARYKAAAPSNYFAMLLNGNCHTFASLPDWYLATSAAGPGAERSNCKQSGAAGSENFEDEAHQLLSSGSQLQCCGHPLVASAPVGAQLLGYMRVSEWASLPLVPAQQAQPAAQPPLWAAIKDNCFGPTQPQTAVLTHPLYACPRSLDYVQYGVPTVKGDPREAPETRPAAGGAADGGAAAISKKTKEERNAQHEAENAARREAETAARELEAARKKAAADALSAAQASARGWTRG